ncbi:MAG TPA: phosphatase PAP2 family protein [Candidatus Baltobacteraceae bacterium]|nr:phosphatase PAP2 family protein [Candidatus Baltobacteraceae bacterium]
MRTRDIDVAGVLALALPAIALFTAFVWLGFYVTVHGEPPALWSFEQAIHGRAVRAAWVLTNIGYAYVLAPLFAATAFVGVVSPRWRVPAFYVLVVALICWGAADNFQHFFARPRRADWLIRHEHAFSYPSSHAAISTGFYFLWGLVLLRSRLPAWLAAGAFLALTALTLGIMWSRVALGAHYLTDVIGGAVLGGALILLAAAFLRTGGRRPFAR